MTINSRQKAPLSPRRRLHLRVVRVVIVAIAVIVCGQALGPSVVPLLLALAAAWVLRTNELENGRDD